MALQRNRFGRRSVKLAAAEVKRKPTDLEEQAAPLEAALSGSSSPKQDEEAGTPRTE